MFFLRIHGRNTFIDAEKLTAALVIKGLWLMFKVGDFVVYGSNGVCRITEVGPINCPGVDQTKIYYTMTPCYIRDSSIYTPVDNERVVIRKVMSEDEAKEFLDQLDNIKAMPVEEEKKRELLYKQALLTCEPAIIVSLIKTIYGRMQERISEGKKVTSSDAKYFHIAEDSLYGELAISLGMKKDEVGPYVHERMHKVAV